jgi:hypothetical protein
VGHTLALVNKICHQSGLRLPIMPDRLKALSRDDLSNPDLDVFEDVLGWTLERKKPAKPSRGVRRSNAQAASPVTPIRPEEYVPLGVTFEEIAERAKTLERSRRKASPSSERSFKVVSVPLRRLSERHRGVDDESDDCWKVFDFHVTGLSERRIARRLWPGRLEVSVKAARQAVYDHLKKAERWIKSSYSPSPAQPGRRTRYGAKGKTE